MRFPVSRLAARMSARRAISLAMALALAMAVTPLAFAAEPFAAPKAAESVPATSAGSLAQVTLSLMLVLAAVFAAAWVVRRLRNFGRPGAGAIEIIADVAVGTKERAVLVQVGTQQVLLGVAPGRVNTLHVLAEPVLPKREPTDVSGLVGQDAGARPDFKAILKRSLGL